MPERRPRRPATPPPPQLVTRRPRGPGTEHVLACVVSNRAGNSTQGKSILWLDRLYTGIGAARRAARSLVDTGQATLAFVVVVRATGECDIPLSAVYPTRYVRPLEHYEDVWSQLEED